MLFEHVAPLFDRVEQGGLEWLAVHTEPFVNELDVVEFAHILVGLLVLVHLSIQIDKHKPNTINNVSKAWLLLVL